MHAKGRTREGVKEESTQNNKVVVGVTNRMHMKIM